MANTMSKYGSNTNRPLLEIVGLSTDAKPTDSIEGVQIQNGSSFRELDTGKRFLFDAENTTWNEVSSGGGGGGSTLIEKSISANGVYNASDDSADRYSKVTVDVPSGGGTSQPRKDVNFYDYDGTIVNSYTAAEFANLATMPDNPSHEGLTAQGWNWSLSDAKTYVASHGVLDIGQMYITSDGKTRLYIELISGRLSPVLQLYLHANSELDIDWGDGSAHSTFTSTRAGLVNERHNYASAEDYVIAITVINGGFRFATTSSTMSSLLTNGNNSTTSPDIGYLGSIYKIEIGTGVPYIDPYAFSYCGSLLSITLPNNISEIGSYAFDDCYSLKSITLPNGISKIYDRAFNLCYSLKRVLTPKTVVKIYDGAFRYCREIEEIILPNGLTDIYSEAFANCQALGSIIIPNSVTLIKSQAFSGCYSLATITIDKAEGSISGSPWGASTSSPTSTQIIWTG